MSKHLKAMRAPFSLTDAAKELGRTVGELVDLLRRAEIPPMIEIPHGMCLKLSYEAENFFFDVEEHISYESKICHLVIDHSALCKIALGGRITQFKFSDAVLSTGESISAELAHRAVVTNLQIAYQASGVTNSSTENRIEKFKNLFSENINSKYFILKKSQTILKSSEPLFKLPYIYYFDFLFSHLTNPSHDEIERISITNLDLLLAPNKVYELKAELEKLEKPPLSQEKETNLEMLNRLATLYQTSIQELSESLKKDWREHPTYKTLFDKIYENLPRKREAIDWIIRVLVGHVDLNETQRPIPVSKQEGFSSDALIRLNQAQSVSAEIRQTTEAKEAEKAEKAKEPNLKRKSEGYYHELALIELGFPSRAINRIKTVLQ
ncbi:hypothetical protein GE543_09860 [Pseudomonas sp. SZ57]|uniref:hypothetical protein n=1 Tax=Pseudomonas sp. SZ57 TaxID=2662259 RepID=UPI001290EC07|nr:hypothetical protein [Pseudomonas sp. SZ57]MQQ34651.1 hypothetical protein [Pseudomonas sp. SZ57]